MTLRQFRTEAIVGIGLLTTLAIVVAVTGVHLLDVNNAFRSACKAARECASVPNPVINVDTPLQGALPLIVIITPALIGLFFGAPLVARELEMGTFRLVWTQSITRRRWFAVKLAVIGIISMMTGGLVTWMVDWWASPLDALRQNRFGLAQFGFHEIAPIGYTAFAFALGVASGVLLRRTVAAMVLTGVGFAATRLAVTYWVRPNLISPAHKSIPFSSGSDLDFSVSTKGSISLNISNVRVPNGWVYSTTALNKAGRVPTSLYLLHTCPAVFKPGTILNRSRGGMQSIGKSPGTPAGSPWFQACFNKLDTALHMVVTYQPASRFWLLQWAETGIFLAAAIALCGLTYCWLRRQYS